MLFVFLGLANRGGLSCLVEMDGGDAVAHFAIVHNENMCAWLAKRGIPFDRMIPLGLFDYLIPEFTPFQDTEFDKTVIIAGNLSSQKSPYLSHLKEIEGVRWRLFGPNYDAEWLAGDNVSYGGSFPPEQIPFKLGTGFGLVWDGTDIDTCSGASGEYLRINNPHKLSLFLAAGLPVFIWNEAAEAAFVNKQAVGIPIANLKEIGLCLAAMTAAEYEQLVANVHKVGASLRSGEFTRAAILSAMRIVDDKKGFNILYESST